MHKVRLTHNNHNQINKFDRSIFLANKKESQYCSLSLSLSLSFFLYGHNTYSLYYNSFTSLQMT